MLGSFHQMDDYNIIVVHNTIGVPVSEKSIMEAVRYLFYRMKLVVEPSGALGLAAVLSRVVVPEGRIGIILSGGNIDAEVLAQILADK